MLGTLESEQKADWKSHVAAMVHAYNCTCNETRGYTPYLLMFGSDQLLLVDVVFGLSAESEETSMISYVEKLKERLQNA